MSRVSHGKSRVCHGAKPQFQSMFTRVVTVSRLQTPMCQPLPHQRTVEADLSRGNGVKAEGNQRRKSHGGGSAPKIFPSLAHMFRQPSNQATGPRRLNKSKRRERRVNHESTLIDTST